MEFIDENNWGPIPTQRCHPRTFLIGVSWAVGLLGG